MCGRYIQLNKTNMIKKKFNLNSSLSEDIISYNISPSQNSLILLNNNEIKIEKAKWGYSFINNKTNMRKNVINSRFETIKEKILFKDSYYNRKCIIPTNGYYEWHLEKEFKVPYFVHVDNKESFYFAGIWKYYNFHETTKKVFTIITKPANNLLNKIHKRMPIIFSHDEATEYLYDTKSSYLNSAYESMLEEFIDYYKVEKIVNNPLNNSKECIKRI